MLKVVLVFLNLINFFQPLFSQKTWNKILKRKEKKCFKDFFNLTKIFNLNFLHLLNLFCILFRLLEFFCIFFETFWILSKKWNFLDLYFKKIASFQFCIFLIIFCIFLILSASIYQKFQIKNFR